MSKNMSKNIANLLGIFRGGGEYLCAQNHKI